MTSLVRNSGALIGLSGQPLCVCMWKHALTKWLYMCVCVNLFAHASASICFQQRSLWNVHAVTRLMTAVLLWFLPFTRVFPLFSSVQHSCLPTQKRGNHPSVPLCNTHAVQVKSECKQQWKIVSKTSQWEHAEGGKNTVEKKNKKHLICSISVQNASTWNRKATKRLKMIACLHLFNLQLMTAVKKL